MRSGKNDLAFKGAGKILLSYPGWNRTLMTLMTQILADFFKLLRVGLSKITVKCIIQVRRYLISVQEMSLSFI